MAVIQHRFISPVADEGDPTVVGPNEWNDGHELNGGSDGDYLVWDSTTFDRVSWENSWAKQPFKDITKPPFNAVNNGTVDTLSAINAALALGNIIIPSGTYPVTGKVIVPSNRSIVLLPGATIQAMTGSIFNDEGILHLSGVSGVLIAGGGAIHGNKTGNPLGRANGIHIVDSLGVTVFGIAISDCPGSTAQGGASGDGVYIGGTGGSSNITIQNCIITGNVRTGVTLAKGSNLRVTDNAITNTTGTSNGYGLSIESALPGDVLTDIKVLGNTISSNEKSVVISENTGVGSCIISNNNFGSHRTGPNIYIKRSETSFTDNAVLISNGDGVFVQNCSRIRVSNNLIYGTNATAENVGVRLSDCSNTIVTDNNIRFVRLGAIGIDQIAPNGSLASSFINISGNNITNCGTNSAVFFQAPVGIPSMQYIHCIDNIISDGRGGSAALFGIATANLDVNDSFTWDIHGNIINGPGSNTNDNRFKVFQKLHIEPTLDFGVITGPAYQDLNVVLNGVNGGDTVYLGVPSGAMVAATTYQAFVSGTGQITVRCLVLTGTVNPPSSTFKITVERNI